MKAEEARKWKKQRQCGALAWIFKYGVLAWGASMSIANVVMAWPLTLEEDARLLYFQIPLWLAVGTGYGIAMWYVMEWQYRRHVRSHGEPQPDIAASSGMPRR